jgi:hypothetical protein
MPFLYDSLIHNSTPVLSRRTQQPASVHPRRFRPRGGRTLAAAKSALARFTVDASKLQTDLEGANRAFKEFGSHIDVINHFEFPDGERVLRQALPIASRLARLKKRAQAAGMSTIYVNDNFGQLVGCL